jgi:hypothetical protein
VTQLSLPLLRFAVILALVGSTIGAASAQDYRSGYGFGYGGNGAYGYPGAFSVGGYGYLYDPYATGRFRAPDLMDDPVYQYQNKFNSRYPGRYRSKLPPLELRLPPSAGPGWTR